MKMSIFCFFVEEHSFGEALEKAAVIVSLWKSEMMLSVLQHSLVSTSPHQLCVGED